MSDQLKIEKLLEFLTTETTKLQSTLQQYEDDTVDPMYEELVQMVKRIGIITLTLSTSKIRELEDLAGIMRNLTTKTN